MNNLSSVEMDKVKMVLADPVMWARVFTRSYDPIQKKIVPWTARWYQEKIMRDPSLKKVARCGRRTGKSDCMVIDSMWRTHTRPKYRALFVTPFENQIRLIFVRIKEIIEMSPELKKDVIKMTFNPYMIQWSNGSMIIGFTTGASSGSAGASIRGQRADYIYVDEADYLGDGDFDTVAMIAAERGDIGMFVSSTPTGKRSLFYQLCTNKKLGWSEHYHPSMDNPNFDENMDRNFKEQLSEQGYIHEVLAEFGTEEAGVFNKDAIDRARRLSFYHYDLLDKFQVEWAKPQGRDVEILHYPGRAPQNIFRTIGVDWDKYKATSNIVILDFLTDLNMFRITKRIEVPRGEYSYDKAVNMVVQLNEQYNPSWIYVDRGAGEYQIERLRLIGEENPRSGLHNKVKGWQFSQTLDVMDPHTKQVVKEPMKPFMVNQLCIAFERERIAISPFDDAMYKQLIDYHVVRITQNGTPVFSDENEHSIDALGLAFLAFVLEFPDLAKQIKKPKMSSKIEHTSVPAGGGRIAQVLSSLNNTFQDRNRPAPDPRELRGDRPTWFKVPSGPKVSSSGQNWGSRGSREGGRSSW